ncbi:hypothetical protein ACFVJK_30450 [Streptomyces sp. NPDC127172]|uniref:hypothetical protein n=1 Tax=Streptomyces sp. NPDC127172 TaxID=3345382 RepID=UPI0036416666
MVTDQDEPALAGPADDDRQPGGRHAAPVVRVPLAGSATMRALIALGAVLSAIGISIGTAGAALGFDEPPMEEADPDFAPVPEAVMPDAPADAVSAAASGTAAGHWAPAIRPVKAHTYKLSAPIPVADAGRHRKPASTEGQGEQNPDTGQPGRHRKPVSVEGQVEQNTDTGGPGRHRYTHQPDTPETGGTTPARVAGTEHTGRHGDGGHGHGGHGHGHHHHGYGSHVPLTRQLDHLDLIGTSES